MRRTVVVMFASLALVSAVVAGPNSGPPSHPPASGVSPYQPQTYGLCSAPQNPADYASSPVPVSEDACRYYQDFKSTSPTATYGSTCGGYAVTFGPSGALDPSLTNLNLTADWGDTALTAATCGDARIAAVGWGYRCKDAACKTGTWEVIGGPEQRKGTWNAIGKVCYTELGWTKSGIAYHTLSVDVIATQKQGAVFVKRRASATIDVWRNNGKCLQGSNVKK